MNISIETNQQTPNYLPFLPVPLQPGLPLQPAMIFSESLDKKKDPPKWVYKGG
mgnify:CR=1 FL=1